MKMTRAQVEEAKGKKEPPKPAPVPQPSPAPAPNNKVLETKLDSLTEQLAKTTQVFAASAVLMSKKEQAEPQAKKLEAIIHRDADGKMSRVEINVI